MRSRLKALVRHLTLAWDLAYRDLSSRYSHSAGGLIWLLITPVSFAGIYWMVFGYFLHQKWHHPVTGSEVPYIAPLFAGLATYFLVSDVVMTSLSTFRQKSQYVKRASVPLWVLWLSTVFRVAVSAGVNFTVLIGLAVFTGLMTWKTIVLIPLALTPVIMTGVAISLFLSLLGAFFADLDEVARIVLRIAFYTSPVTYPLSTIPDRVVGYFWANPLTSLVETVRRTFVFGMAPSLLPSLAMLAASLALLALGIWLYERLKGPVVDVV